MKKEIIKPFDLEKAKAGAKLKTINGHSVNILEWDLKNEYPIVGVISIDEIEELGSWTKKGENNKNHASDFDLVIVEEVEEPEFWSDDENIRFNGFSIVAGEVKKAVDFYNLPNAYHIFATEKQAKSALAMARISQIMANDIENFGGVVSDEEWGNGWQAKYSIIRRSNEPFRSTNYNEYTFLAFHTAQQRNLFLEKYPQLVHDFLMIPDEQTK